MVANKLLRTTCLVFGVWLGSEISVGTIGISRELYKGDSLFTERAVNDEVE